MGVSPPFPGSSSQKKNSFEGNSGTYTILFRSDKYRNDGGKEEVEERARERKRERERERERARLGHFMMEGDLLIWRRLVRGENPTDDVRPRGGAADVRQFFISEGLNDLVEIGRCPNRESSEKDGSVLPE